MVPIPERSPGLFAAFLTANNRAQPSRQDYPSFGESWRLCNVIADHLRRHGPFEPHRLPMEEMEYTTLPEVMK
jgi:fructose 1,6-bisphosphatase